MFPSLSAAQRQAIAEEGTPTAIIDDETGQAFLLFPVRLSTGLDGSVIADIAGLGIIGEGDGPEEALMAVVAAAQSLAH